jgi:hypothetical protein
MLKFASMWRTGEGGAVDCCAVSGERCAAKGERDTSDEKRDAAGDAGSGPGPANMRCEPKKRGIPASSMSCSLC